MELYDVSGCCSMQHLINLPYNNGFTASSASSNLSSLTSSRSLDSRVCKVVMVVTVPSQSYMGELLEKSGFKRVFRYHGNMGSECTVWLWDRKKLKIRRK